MIANAAGVPILLQASPIQLQDLVGTLSPGDAFKGRVVELLPQNQALVSIRGQNVVAQLPANANAAVAKGDILSLLVSQASPGEGASPASLVLKLLASTAPAPTVVGSAAASVGSGAAGFGALEQALAAAKLPVNSVNLALAQTLSRLGVPVDAQTLQNLSRSVESLLANEQAPTGQAGSALDDPALRQLMQEGLTQLKVAAQLSPSSQQSVALMQAARGMQEALDGSTAAAGSAPAQASQEVQDWPAAIGQALAEVLADPGASQIQALNTVLAQAAQAAPPSGGAPSANASAQGAVASTGSGLAPNSADFVSMREAMAQWLGPMQQGAEALNAGALASSAEALAGTFADASQASTQRLISAVQAQSPQSGAQAIQNAAADTLRQIADFYGQLPSGRTLPGLGAVQADLKSMDLPVPAANLSTLPPETVADAAAWLNARGLPPQRPLVETVAAWMAQDRSVLPAAQRALQSQEGLGQGALDARPGLKQAYEALGQALNNAGIDPETDGLAGRLQAWASAQGLTLESDFAQPFDALYAPEAPGSAAAAGVPRVDATGGNTLRGSLLKLESELNQALQSAQPTSSSAAGLNSALRETQGAVHGFNALPLQAQGAPSFDTVHLPLPVWMNGVLGDGSLSVTWRQGRERELDDKEPVNVAVSLNTESLGPVTVTLQVWKNAAGARVIAQDKATAAFLAQGADDLKAGFKENTPFALQNVDFAAADAAAAPAAVFSGSEPASTGLSLSA